MIEVGGAGPRPLAEVGIRAATAADVPLLLELIRELAAFERLSQEVVATHEDLHRSLFGPRPAAEALIAEVEGVPAGFALFFQSFSTFVGRPGLYLEDLYVRPSVRRRGVGKALLVRLAQLAVERQCGRFEWAVLNWNAAAIAFYRSLGAVPMDAWTVYRLSGDALAQVARM